MLNVSFSRLGPKAANVVIWCGAYRREKTETYVLADTMDELWRKLLEHFLRLGTVEVGKQSGQISSLRYVASGGEKMSDAVSRHH